MEQLRRSPIATSTLICVTALLAGCVDNTDPFTRGVGGAGAGTGEGGATSKPAETELTTSEKLADCNVPPMEGRVVLGYMPNWIGGFGNLADSLDFDTMTHVALAFTNSRTVDSPIDFGGRSDAEIENLVNRAHDKGVKVLASIGGASESDLNLEQIQEEYVDEYIEKLAAYVETHNLDGVDVDIEGNRVKAATYGPFVRKLANRIRPEGKLVTAAVANFFADEVSDEALFCFDFINEMAYDAAGSWTGPDEHSSRSFARSRVAYWSASRRYPDERIVIGLPFYGYCWGSGCRRDGGQIPYRSIEALYPDQLEGDWIRDPENDVQINFNGAGTIEYKTDYSKNYGGVMIWDMSQDGSEKQLFEGLKRGL